MFGFELESYCVKIICEHNDSYVGKLVGNLRYVLQK